MASKFAVLEKKIIIQQHEAFKDEGDDLYCYNSQMPQHQS